EDRGVALFEACVTFVTPPGTGSQASLNEDAAFAVLPHRHLIGSQLSFLFEAVGFAVEPGIHTPLPLLFRGILLSQTVGSSRLGRQFPSPPGALSALRPEPTESPAGRRTGPATRPNRSLLVSAASMGDKSSGPISVRPARNSLRTPKIRL